MMSNKRGEFILYVTAPGERPLFYLLQRFVWEEDIDTDTDGNAYKVDSKTWTELTVATRDDRRQRFDVDPIQEKPLILKIRSKQKHIAARAAYALTVYTKGGVSEQPTGPFDRPETLIPEMGETFDLAEALKRNSWLMQVPNR